MLRRNSKSLGDQVRLRISRQYRWRGHVRFCGTRPTLRAVGLHSDCITAAASSRPVKINWRRVDWTGGGISFPLRSQRGAQRQACGQAVYRRWSVWSADVSQLNAPGGRRGHAVTVRLITRCRGARGADECHFTRSARPAKLGAAAEPTNERVGG